MWGALSCGDRRSATPDEDILAWSDTCALPPLLSVLLPLLHGWNNADLGSAEGLQIDAICVLDYGSPLKQCSWLLAVSAAAQMSFNDAPLCDHS